MINLFYFKILTHFWFILRPSVYICTAYQESPDCPTFKHEPIAWAVLGPRIPYLILLFFQKLNPGMNFVLVKDRRTGM